MHRHRSNNTVNTRQPDRQPERYGSLARSALALLLGALLPGAVSVQVLAETFEPYASTYVAPAHSPVLIENLTVLTGEGEQLEATDVFFEDGRLAAVGADLEVQRDGLVTIDGAGKWLTPGLIDVHSHLGNYAAPATQATDDGNEMTDPVTAHVWAEHSVWPQDPQFGLALAGGVTTLMVLPGSANLFGGRTVTLKNVRARSVYDMLFPGAPHGLKIACGENPKRVYGERLQAPMTRMGNVAGFRAAWIEAEDYRREWRAYQDALDEYLAEQAERQLATGEASATEPAVEASESDLQRPEPPVRDLGLETLMGVLDGEILVHNHCYRADEMVVMLNIAQEFDFSVSAFHHAVESYKVADVLREHDVCSAVWADWWGFKLEAWDVLHENAALIHQAGACAIIHSDSAMDIQRLNQEAAKAMAAGQRRGMAIDAAAAIAWITANPARAMGIDHLTGTVSVGKAADLVLWNRNPMSIYARALMVFIDGVLVHERGSSETRLLSDFDLGQTYRGRRP